MLDFETLRLIWWFLLGFLLAGFAIFDGFDFGVGALLPWIGSGMPYFLGFPMAMVVTLLLGLGPGLVSVLLIIAGGEMYIVGSLPTAFEPAGLLRLALSLAGCAFPCLVVHAVRVARMKARVNETRLNHAQQIANVGSWEWDIATGALFWSDQTYRQMGEDPEGFTPSHASFSQRVHPADRPAFEAAVAQALAGAGSYDGEFRIVRPDGVVRTLHSRGEVVRGPNDQPARMTGVCLDITARNQAEALLKTDLAALTRMHSLSGQLLGTGGLQPLLQEVMDAAVAIVQAERGTLQLLEGQSLRIVAQHAHQPPFLEFFADAEQRASACGAALQRAERVVVPDVEASPLLVGTPSLAVLRAAGVRAVQSSPMVSRAGKLLGILTTHWGVPYTPNEHDLWRLDLLARQAADLIETTQAQAALRASEQRLRLAHQGAKLGAFEWNVQTNANTWTPELEAMYGLAPGEFGKTQPAWEQLVHPEDRPAAIALVKLTFATGEPVEGEWRVVWRDGTVHWIAGRFQAFKDDDGHPLRLTGVNLDITARKQAEQALAEAQAKLQAHAAKLEETVTARTAKLQETVADLEHFSYAITHDMRAPLRAMQGFASIMEEECVGCERPDNHDFLRRIKVATTRLDSLITDSLNYGRTLRQEIVLEPVDLGQLIPGLVLTYPNLHPDHADIELAASLPTVVGNQAALTQCFSNLLGNAVKFAKPNTKPRIRVYAEPAGLPASPRPLVSASSPASSHVRLWVEDDGTGISKEALPNIFKLFVRATKDIEGTGLGLAIVKKVVERMGGRVGVESVEGQGSRFWVELQKFEA